MSLGVILVGPVFVKLVFKFEFHMAGLLAQLASIGGWFILLQVTADRALLAQGKTKPLAMSNAVNLAVTVVAGLAGRWFEIKMLGHKDGLIGFMLGLALGKLAGHLMIQIELARGGISIFRQDAFYSAGLLALALVGILGPRHVPGYQGQELLYEAIAACVVCALTCGWAGLKVLRGIR
jgi:O-antigen/teichoic acid export membrane protein